MIIDEFLTIKDRNADEAIGLPVDNISIDNNHCD